MIRKKRKLARFSKIIFLLSTVALVILIVFLFLRSNYFHIKQVEIQGEGINCVTGDQLKNAFDLYGQNFFLLNTKQLQEDLKKKFVCIKNINFSRSVPDKVKIEIISRKPAAVLLNLNDKQASPSFLIENIATPEASQIRDSFLVDDQGVVFSKDFNNANLPKIYFYDSGIAVGKKLEDIFINNALKVLGKITTLGVSTGKSWISEDIFIINPDTMNPKIIFRLNGKIDTQLASLQLILAEAKIDLKELTFIDLRFDKPIVRFAPKKNG